MHNRKERSGMLKKKHWVALLGLSALLFCGGTIYAMTSAEIVNHFETGTVDIDLTEYQKNGDKEELWTEKMAVLPADRISKIPRICNEGTDCYIRAKVTFRETDGITEENLYGIGEDWIRAEDGYYYFTRILSHGESADFFQGVQIPADFEQSNEEKPISLEIDADAIQSQNFSPDFQSENPWGEVEILKSETKKNYDIKVLKSTETKLFQIRYEGRSKELIKNSDDFFYNLPELMPGAHYEDQVQLVNQGSEAVKLYFRSEVSKEDSLTDQIRLQIISGIGDTEKTVYSGNLRAEELSETVILGILPKGKEGEFQFTIDVPKELGNDYSGCDSCVKWIFSTEPIVDAPETVHTGDSSKLGFYLCLAGLSLGMTAVFGLKKHKREGEME